MDLRNWKPNCGTGHNLSTSNLKAAALNESHLAVHLCVAHQCAPSDIVNLKLSDRHVVATAFRCIHLVHDLPVVETQDYLSCNSQLYALE